MQGRTAGSPRAVPAKHRGTAERAAGGAGDALTLGVQVGRDHGSRPALVRSLVSMSLLALGLGSAVLSAGTDLGQAASSAPPVDGIVMPRPRIHPLPAETVAAAPVVLTAPAAFAPVHDLDSGSGSVDRVSYDYLLTETATGDPNDILEFGPMRIRRHLVQTIVRAAQAVQTDPVLLMAVADKESSFITEVQAKTSSATGLFQFIERTWFGVVRDFGAKHGLTQEAALVVQGDNDRPTVTDPAERARILDLRRDPSLAALLAGEMLKRDAARIAARIGRELTLGEVYLAHFLGPDDAEEFLAKVVDAPKAAAAALLPGPARANRSIFFAATRASGRRKAKTLSLSVAQVHAKFEDMMQSRGERYRDVRTASGLVAYADAGAE